MGRSAIHPGEHLAEQLEELQMSAAELSRQLKVPTNRITEVLNGQRCITGDTALRLGHFFGTSAEFWMNLQKLYELRLADEKAGDTIKALPTLASRGTNRVARNRGRCNSLASRGRDHAEMFSRKGRTGSPDQTFRRAPTNDLTASTTNRRQTAAIEICAISAPENVSSPRRGIRRTGRRDKSEQGYNDSRVHQVFSQIFFRLRDKPEQKQERAEDSRNKRRIACSVGHHSRHVP